MGTIRSKKNGKRTEALSFRLEPELKAELYAASQWGEYSIGITSIVERGIRLAIDELKGKLGDRVE